MPLTTGHAGRESGVRESLHEDYSTGYGQDRLLRTAVDGCGFEKRSVARLSLRSLCIYPGQHPPRGNCPGLTLHMSGVARIRGFHHDDHAFQDSVRHGVPNRAANRGAKGHAASLRAQPTRGQTGVDANV